jgi:light-harvesting complex I chlorophyll a/b binding protein 1
LAVTEGRKGGRAPGDFGFNPLKMGTTAASQKDLAVKEVRNGRLAMWAAAGLLMQESSLPGTGALH